ncbi:hypothetical protein B0H11DRAFT_2230515 [Mycena galericulata]|nr:hypothetical protein B0H11DRAFT_2230515 [Mycena galericulata]
MPTLPKRLRDYFSRNPDRKLPPDRTHSAGPGDADPVDPLLGHSITNEVHRQQQLFLSQEALHVRPLVISSAQGTHSIRTDADGIPYAHGTCMNAELTIVNLETGLTSTQNGHVEYIYKAAEPAWGLDVPMATAEEVRQTFFDLDRTENPISNQTIAAMFPIASREEFIPTNMDIGSSDSLEPPP